MKNTGKMTGKEIIQLYVWDVESSVIRPDKELKSFEKVELKPGEELDSLFSFHYTLSNVSWLNLIEPWFSEEYTKFPLVYCE